MPLWHCPHCGTPQSETARCWVCRKSTTSCGTCRAFRRGVAGSLGYCGLDRRREPLRGDEIRGCWAEARATDRAIPVGAPPSKAGSAGRTMLVWRELEPPPAEVTASATAGTGAIAAAGTGTSGTSGADGPGGAAPSDRPPIGAVLPEAAWVEGFWADLEA